MTVGRFGVSADDADVGIGSGFDPEDGTCGQGLAGGYLRIVTGGWVPLVRGGDHLRTRAGGGIELLKRVGGGHGEGEKIPAGVKADALDAGVGGERTGDDRDARGAIEHVFGGLVVVADFEGVVNV